MLPARWSLMGELPKNQNGKIDRRALQEMFARALTVGAGDR
jgi:acyl-coenzyme A synthetase/AMP-(fatty) acid ligase